MFLKPVRRCGTYKPKFGKKAKRGVSYEEFRRFYAADLFYQWVGLDSPLIYAAHKAAGGMTSIYRQLGAGGQDLFRRIVQDQLGLDAEQST